jgi:hypothetical protein
VGVARLFRDFLDVMVLDEVDAALAPAIAALGVEPVVEVADPDDPFADPAGF